MQYKILCIFIKNRIMCKILANQTKTDICRCENIATPFIDRLIFWGYNRTMLSGKGVGAMSTIAMPLFFFIFHTIL